MDVIGHSVGCEQVAVEVSNNAANVFVKFVLDVFRDELPAFFGAEDDVVI
jgi:hypothetical protein